jgi:hypothetical protein
MGEAVEVAGAEDESTAQLEGIASEFMLAVAGSAGALAALEIVAAEEVENVGGFQVGEFVGLALLVDEEGEVDFGFFLEEAGVAGVAEANSGETCVFGAEGLLVFAQLRDVFAAEDSAVMAKKDEDGRICFPKRAEANAFAEGIGERDIGELLAEGFGHDGHD